MIAALLLLIAQVLIVPVGKPVTFAFDHDGVDVDGYRVYLDGAKALDLAPGVLVSGTAEFTIASFAKGAHTLYVEAFNARGAASSAVLTLDAGPTGPPGAPKNVRCVRNCGG